MCSTHAELRHISHKRTAQQMFCKLHSTSREHKSWQHLSSAQGELAAQGANRKLQALASLLVVKVCMILPRHGRIVAYCLVAFVTAPRMPFRRSLYVHGVALCFVGRLIAITCSAGSMLQARLPRFSRSRVHVCLQALLVPMLYFERVSGP